jgi:hypothetical protein
MKSSVETWVVLSFIFFPDEGLLFLIKSLCLSQKASLSLSEPGSDVPDQESAFEVGVYYRQTYTHKHTHIHTHAHSRSL